MLIENDKDSHFIHSFMRLANKNNCIFALHQPTLLFLVRLFSITFYDKTELIMANCKRLKLTFQIKNLIIKLVKTWLFQSAINNGCSSIILLSFDFVCLSIKFIQLKLSKWSSNHIWYFNWLECASYAIKAARNSILFNRKSLE